MHKIDEYLKIKDAAALLGVSPGTLRNWEKLGKLKAHRNPNNQYRLYKKIDLEKLLNVIAAPAQG
ncbi:MAG: helix-turn-helix domain-containing protein [Rhabdochlamydiaceae bacterium]|nr:helix-turn-helix domain-containing protein [Rhabdochlamydiaceae bacterium]